MEKKEPLEEAGVVYDTAIKKVDMRNLRATDFPFNKRVILTVGAVGREGWSWTSTIKEQHDEVC